MVSIGGATAAGLGAAFTGKTLFDYNRHNYLYDRKMRQQQEFKVLSFRNAQAALWREDIRNLIELTVGKMDSFTITSALLFGFCIELGAAGRLMPGVPPWLMWLYMLNLTGAFAFLFMSVWFAMHASVAASAGSVRLLTQMVRLPIPSWEQLESIRTYGQSAESLSMRKLLRVPFVSPMMGQHGRHNNTEPAAEPSGPTQSASPSKAFPPEEAVDPWNLERAGTNIYELEDRPTAERRHVALWRQASAQWQAHEAMARVAMTLGALHILYSVMYYVLGNILVTDGEPLGAWLISAMLSCAGLRIIFLDLSLTEQEWLWCRRLVVGGPVCSCITAAMWCQWRQPWLWFSYVIMVFAFGFHAGLLYYLVERLANVVPQPNGALLPLRWRSVLYLDVFGWLGDGSSATKITKDGYDAVKTDETLISPEGSPREPEDMEAEEHLSCSGSRGTGLHPVVQQASSPSVLRGWMRPTRPEDATHDEGPEIGLASADSQKVLQGCVLKPGESLPGVGSVGAVHTCHDGAFVPDSYYPPRGPDGTPIDRSAQTGHDGKAPWHFLRWMARLLTCLHCVGMVRSAAWVCGVHDVHVVSLEAVLARKWFHENQENATELMREQFDEGIGWDGGNFLQVPRAPPAQRLAPGSPVDTIWPHQSRFRPNALSCDAEGRRFVVADDFGVYSASLNREEPLSRGDGAEEAPSFRRRLREAMGDADPTTDLALPRLTANFTRAPVCRQLEGQIPKDIAVICSNDGNPPATSDGVAGATASAPRQQCSAVVLYAEGHTVLAECPLEPDRFGAAGSSSWDISNDWLDEFPEGLELIQSLALDSECRGAPNSSAVFAPDHLRGCAFVTTTEGRLVQLRRHVTKRTEMVPQWAAQVRRAEDHPRPPAGSAVQRRGSLHILPGGLVLVLRPPPTGQQQQQKLPGTMWALDAKQGVVVGEWELPAHRGLHWSALCGGGGSLYVLGHGDKADSGPSIWRFPLPKELRRSTPPGIGTASELAAPSLPTAGTPLPKM